MVFALKVCSFPVILRRTCHTPFLRLPFFGKPVVELHILHIHTYIHIYIHIYTYLHTYMHIYIHTYIYIIIYKYTLSISIHSKKKRPTLNDIEVYTIWQSTGALGNPGSKWWTFRPHIPSAQQSSCKTLEMHQLFYNSHYYAYRSPKSFQMSM